MEDEELLEAVAQATMKPEVGRLASLAIIIRLKKIMVVSKDLVKITDLRIDSLTPMEIVDGMTSGKWNRIFSLLRVCNSKGQIE